MTSITLYNLQGTKTGTLTLPDSVFSAPAKPGLLAQAIRVYLSNQRQNTKATQTRSEVSYSTKKIWKQKGTGRARHGSRRAPIFVGGGVAHGPTGNESYTLNLPTKMRRAALRGSLTTKAKSQAMNAIASIADFKGKTTDLQKIIKAISGNTKKTLFILDKPYVSVIKAGRNIKNLTLTQAARVNTYEVLNHEQIIITPESLQVLDPDFKPATKAAASPKASKTPTASKPKKVTTKQL